MLPYNSSTLLSPWQGLFKIRRIGPVNYETEQTGCQNRLQVYHVSLLERWGKEEGLLMKPISDSELGPEGITET